MNNPAVWFEIYVDDMQRARAFYEAVFQVTLERLSADALEMWAFPGDQGSPGAGGALVHVDGMPAGNNSTIVYFGCDDCAAEGSRVADAGGSIVKDKFSIGEYGYIVLAHDSEGNMIGMHSMQ